MLLHRSATPNVNRYFGRLPGGLGLCQDELCVVGGIFHRSYEIMRSYTIQTAFRLFCWSSDRGYRAKSHVASDRDQNFWEHFVLTLKLKKHNVCRRTIISSSSEAAETSIEEIPQIQTWTASFHTFPRFGAHNKPHSIRYPNSFAQRRNRRASDTYSYVFGKVLGTFQWRKNGFALRWCACLYFHNQFAEN